MRRTTLKESVELNLLNRWRGEDKTGADRLTPVEKDCHPVYGVCPNELVPLILH